MSTNEWIDRLHAIIDRHVDDEAWLTRILEILESAEPVSNDNWWAHLTDEQKQRIDASILAADAGEFVSNEDVLDSL